MKKDRLIKQELQNAFPAEKTFGEFCRENNIVQEQPAKRRSARNLLLKAVMPALSAAAIVLAIVLPVSLKNDVPQGPSDGITAPSYGLHSDSITAEEIFADADLMLFNPEYMFDEAAYFYKMYVDDKTGEDHVGYTVEAKMYGAKMADVPYVYGFTLTTAKKNVLAVLDKSVYYGCDKTASYGGVEYKYNVSKGLVIDMHVYYTIGKYEYFLSVSPYGTAAIADESYMQMFLRLAFDSVDGAERIEFKTQR